MALQLEWAMGSGQRAERRVQSAECRAESAECRAQSAERKMQRAAAGSI